MLGVGCPVPELTVIVVAPAHHLAAHEQGTRVIAAQADTRCRRDSRNLNRSDAMGVGTVPELTVTVGAPAHHLAGREQGTRVIATQVHLQGFRTFGHEVEDEHANESPRSPDGVSVDADACATARREASASDGRDTSHLCALGGVPGVATFFCCDPVRTHGAFAGANGVGVRDVVEIRPGDLVQDRFHAMRVVDARPSDGRDVRLVLGF